VWGKTGSKLYGPKTGIDYRDNQLRFSLLCQVPFCFVFSTFIALTCIKSLPSLD
jgi:hypothetical protein